MAKPIDEYRSNQDALFAQSHEEWAAHKSTPARGPASGSDDWVDAPLYKSLKSFWYAGTGLGIAKVNGEWVDAKSPRTIAEARKAAEAPRYYDKHGTEVFDGDKVKLEDGTEMVARPDSSILSPGYQYRGTVLSRADGTPVYRYNGGEDVRIGDRYLNGVAEQTLSDIPFAKPPKISEGEIAYAYGVWSARTLIRRAGVEKDRSVEDYTVTQKPTKQVSTWSPEIHELDRFLDWCNQPTLTQRFEAFKSETTEALRGLHALTVTFDMNQKMGIYAEIRCAGVLGGIVVSEGQDAAGHLNRWVKQLGWEALKRGKR